MVAPTIKYQYHQVSISIILYQNYQTKKCINTHMHEHQCNEASQSVC